MDDLLDSLTPEEFAERYAYYELSGQGDARYLAGLVAATVHNEMSRYIAAKAGQKIRDADLHNPEQYLPDVMRTKIKRKPKTMSVKATDRDAAEQLAKRMGAI